MSAAISFLEPLAVLAVGVAVGRALGPRVDAGRAPWLARVASLVEGSVTPWLIGAITTFVIWYAWGHVQPTPSVHDEASYLFQAQTFAGFRWTNPQPPVPDFFQQIHVLVDPTYSSKYPPGLALLMVPGVWLGFPALVPVLLSAVTAAFLFVVARRVSNAWVALLAWVIWLTTPRNLEWSAGYFSELATGALWMVGWYALLRWRETSATRWLVALAACIGWMVITRPLTAVAYAIPTGAVVLWTVARRGQWRQLGLGVLTGIAILGILPLSNRAIVRDWKAMPWSVYSRQYLPSDRFGFGLDPVPAERKLPPDMAAMSTYFTPMYEQHVPAALPITLWRRTTWLLMDTFRAPRFILLPFAIVALFSMSGEIAFALASAVLLVGLYLGYAHNDDWTLYYHEMQPAVAFVIALGVWRSVAYMTGSGRWAVGAPPSAKPEDGRREGFGSLAAALAVAVMLLCALPYSVGVVSRAHSTTQRLVATRRAFFDRLAALPDPRAVVFVRPSASHPSHRSFFIANEPNLAEAHAWLVSDRGDDNARLIRAAPDRVPYLFDEQTNTLAPYGRP